MSKIFGMAFHSPLIIHSLIPPKDYGRTLLISESYSDIKREVESSIKAARKRPIVAIAGSLAILQVFLKDFLASKHDVQWKVILFDFPGLLVPFDIPSVRWLDCDNQSGGAWQITKLRPEAFCDILATLKPLDRKTAEELLKVARHVPNDRIPEIERIAKSLPASYKDLIPPEETKRQQKKQKKTTTAKGQVVK
jgi:hypothetical protein